MNKQQLKNSILQWAIQGKLVPQIASEGTAEDLLKEIRAEKEKLVKEGKLKKKDLEVKPIEDDEIPFEIPEGWRWCRLCKLGITETGTTPSKAHPEYFGSYIPFLGPANILDNRIVSETQGLSEIGVTYGRVVPSRTILQVCIGGSIGKCAIVDKEVTFNQQINSITAIKCEVRYLYYVLQSETFRLEIMEKATGTATPIINRGNWEDLLIPVPPLAEQKRIVSKIEELMPLVEEYGKAQERLNVLNKELPEKLKKSVLQEAIMGRLVPQDPKEGTADELLAEIRKEKEKLVKEGKLKKKDLEVKPIEEDEVPFEVPSSWKWVRIKDVCHKIVDGDHNPPTGIASKTDYMMLSSKNINFDKLVNLCSVRYLEKEMFDIENQRTQLTVGDVLFTSVGTLGRSCVFNDESLNLCFQRSVSVLSTLIYNQYLKRYLDSPFVQSFVADNATGTAQKGFYLNQLEKMVVPLPPLAEQKRIVEKVETILAKIDS